MGNILRYFFPVRSGDPSPGPEQISLRQRAFEASRQGDVRELQELAEELDRAGGVLLPGVIDPVTKWTLLHAAMEKGSGECVRFLMGEGCSLTRGDASGETPLHVACMYDRLDNMAAALDLDPEVNLEVKDMWGRTPLLKAMVYGSERILRYLLTRPVNLDAQDAFSFSVMHMAVTRDRPDLVQELVSRGASLNVATGKGRSPLSVAIVSLKPSMVRELLTLGASTCNRTGGGVLPSMTAIREFVRRSEGGVVCERSEEVLHLMLVAHGFLLRSDQPNVFQRVLYNADLKRFLPLLHKLFVCSDSLSHDLRTATQLVQDRDGPTPLRLFDLARRSARRALMESGRNVLWAVERLSSNIPPAVKGLLLLKDCDFKEFSLSGLTERDGASC